MLLLLLMLARDIVMPSEAVIEVRVSSVMISVAAAMLTIAMIGHSIEASRGNDH